MRSPHLRRRPLLARRLASGLPPWAVARGSNIAEDEMSALMFDAGFRELVDGYADILAMTREARLARMERIAGEILDDALTRRDPDAALFVLRQKHKKRDAIAVLAKGFCDTLERERARALRLRQEIDAGRLTPATPAPAPAPASDPAPADPVAAAEAAAAMPADRRRADPQDAAIWRKATTLRQKMLDEQLLHHAVTAQAERERRQVPLDPDALSAEAACLATAPLAPDAVLSGEDLQVLAEIRAMYRKAPLERLLAICRAPPRGMERIFAVLAYENHLGGWPGRP